MCSPRPKKAGGFFSPPKNTTFVVPLRLADRVGQTNGGPYTDPTQIQIPCQAIEKRFSYMLLIKRGMIFPMNKNNSVHTQHLLDTAEELIQEMLSHMSSQELVNFAAQKREQNLDDFAFKLARRVVYQRALANWSSDDLVNAACDTFDNLVWESKREE